LGGYSRAGFLGVIAGQDFWGILAVSDLPRRSFF